MVHVTAPGTVLEGLEIAEAGPHLTKDMACVLVEADEVTVRELLDPPSAARHLRQGRQPARGSSATRRGPPRPHRVGPGQRHPPLELPPQPRGRTTRSSTFATGSTSPSPTRPRSRATTSTTCATASTTCTPTTTRSPTTCSSTTWPGRRSCTRSDITFERNTFARCRGFRAYGILLQSMSEVVSRQNLILDNSRGIFMNNTDASVFEENDVVDNDLAVQLNGGCDGNRFVGQQLPRQPDRAPAGRERPRDALGGRRGRQPLEQLPRATTWTGTGSGTCRSASRTSSRSWRATCPRCGSTS